MKPFTERHEIAIAWDELGNRHFVGTGAYDPGRKSFVVHLPESVNNLNLSHSHPSGKSFTLEDIFEAGDRTPPALFVQAQMENQYFLGELYPPERGWPKFEQITGDAVSEHYKALYSAIWANISELSTRSESEILPEHVSFLVDIVLW